MKSYLMRMNEPVGLQKVQIRDDVYKNKRPFPNHDITRVDVALPVTSASYVPQRMDSFSREDNQMYSIAFDVVRLTVAIWTEVKRDAVNSYGHHVLICDFIEVPQGCSVLEMLEIQEGASLSNHLNVQYYKDEIDMLRDRVRQLEADIAYAKKDVSDTSYLERMGII